MLELIGPPAAEQQGGAAPLWTLRSYQAALKACRLLREWRRATSLVHELLQFHEGGRRLELHEDGAYEGGVAAGGAVDGAADDATTSERMRTAAIDSRCFGAAMGACLRARHEPMALETALNLFEEARRVGLADGPIYGAAMQA